jgi:hypothetical protein
MDERLATLLATQVARVRFPEPVREEKVALLCNPAHGLASEEGRRTSFPPLRYGCPLQPEIYNKHG